MDKNASLHSDKQRIFAERIVSITEHVLEVQLYIALRYRLLDAVLDELERHDIQ